MCAMSEVVPRIMTCSLMLGSLRNDSRHCGAQGPAARLPLTIRAQSQSQGDEDGGSDGSRTRRQTSVEEGGGQRMDRFGARVLRLLHLCDRVRAHLSADLLSVQQSHGGDR